MVEEQDHLAPTMLHKDQIQYFPLLHQRGVEKEVNLRQAVMVDRVVVLVVLVVLIQTLAQVIPL